ncbi:MAG: amidase domain-containing protein [Candidatus Cryosericum sp.]
MFLAPADLVSAATYNPLKAIQYADKWWNKRNPAFVSYGFSDCANFVSQCLIAGGLNLKTSTLADKKGSIAQCSSLDTYLTKTLKATVWKKTPAQPAPTTLQVGDVAIFGNWWGLRHAAIVSAKQSNGQPLFNAHTYDRKRTTLDWLFSAWTYVKYYHIVKTQAAVAAAPKPTPAKTAVVLQPAATTRSSIGTTVTSAVPETTSATPLVKTAAATSVTSSGATLNGAVNPDAEPTLWLFEYGTSETYEYATDKQGPLLGSMTYDVNIAVAGLKPGMLYHVRLVRVASDGSLMPGDDMTFRTSEAPRSVAHED